MSGRDQARLKRYRKRAFERQGGLCYWCKKPMIWKTAENAALVWNDPLVCTGDHLVLRAHGGGTTVENIVAACRGCNNSRHWSSTQNPIEGRATLADVWPQPGIAQEAAE